MKNSEKYNALGYLDLTAYYALRNIEKEETEKRKKSQQKKFSKKTYKKQTDEGHAHDSTNFIGYCYV